MDELALATATEAVSMDVDFEEDTSLGENADPQGGHIPPELSDDTMTGEATARPWMTLRSEQVTTRGEWPCACC